MKAWEARLLAHDPTPTGVMGGIKHWTVPPTVEGACVVKGRHPRIKGFARKMRKDPTPAERLLWMYLRNRQIHGERFRRQHRIGYRIADFACCRLKLAIEVDGAYHSDPDQQRLDKIREAELSSYYWDTIRFSNEEVMLGAGRVVHQIRAQVYFMQGGEVGTPP